MATVVEYRKFSLTNLGNNNNKWWNVTLFDNGDVMSEWGRQGDSGQKKTWTGAGRSLMMKKIDEKNKKGYRENQVVEATTSSPVRHIDNSQLHTIASKQIETQSKVVRDLINFLVQVNAHQISGLTGGKIQFDTSSAQFKTTQGIVIPSQVSRARVLLSELADMVVAGSWSDYQFEYKLNEYLSLIPRDFGRKRLSALDILPNLSKVQQEDALLDGLEASFAGLQNAPSVPVIDEEKESEPKIFEVKLDVINDRDIFRDVNKLYAGNMRRGHVSSIYKLDKIYSVHIEVERQAFERDGKKVGNIRRLWHGTKASNLLSILRQGLVIPPSNSPHCTGRLYGNGIYFSDVSTKSLNYATNFWGRGGNTDRTFMFLADVAMGKTYRSTRSSYKDNRHGYDSTFAEAGGGVVNNEMIVYRTSQVFLCYLCEFGR